MNKKHEGHCCRFDHEVTLGCSSPCECYTSKIKTKEEILKEICETIEELCPLKNAKKIEKLLLKLEGLK